MTTSIRKFLLIYLTLALVCVYGMEGMLSYYLSKDEMDELYDANLREVAVAIAAQHSASAGTSGLYGNAQQGLSKLINDEQQFFVRIRGAHDEVLYISSASIALPFATQTGFSTQSDQKQDWRFFSMRAKGELIEVAQSLRLRDIAIAEMALSLIAPQLVFIPLLGFLVWLAIGRGLKPLNELSSSIKNRKDMLLEPLSLDKAPTEIAPLVSALNIFIERLGKMVAILRQFTSDAAHELRTPLTALQLQLDLLEQAQDESQRKHAITQLHSGVERSIALVNQLLTMARVEPGATKSSMELVRLLNLVKECVEELLPMVAAKNIDLGMAASDDTVIYGDKEALRILLNNLLHNAIKFTPAYGVVDINIRTFTDTHELEVKDSGPGIAVEEQARVFDRFYRGIEHKSAGSGLGLSIAREIASQHGAKILLHSPPGQGLTVRIVFDTTANPTNVEAAGKNPPPSDTI